MFTRFKHKSKTLFVDPQSSINGTYVKGEKIELILSPHMYWVKKMKLPISSLREVQKLLPSIFEDSLPPAHYSYRAYKRGSEFILFAYEDKKILKLIAKQGISTADIVGVYFAQSEFQNLESAVEINPQECMYVEDGVVVIAPLSWVDGVSPLDMEQTKRTSQKIKLQQFSHIVDRSSLYKFAGLLGAFALVLLVEIFMTKSAINTLQEEKDLLFEKYSLAPTMMQNRSILSRYKKIYKQQTKVRELINISLHLPLQSQEKIQLMEYKNGIYLLTIKGLSKARMQKILSEFDAKAIAYKSSFKSKKLQLEIQI